MSLFILYCILLKNDSLLRILRFPGYFETPLFRTFFHFPWDFEIAGFDCTFHIMVVILCKSVFILCDTERIFPLREFQYTGSLEISLKNNIL